MTWRSVSLSGLLIALIGFALTRFTVTLAANDSAVQFLFAGIAPLVLGLSLAAFGVILSVGAYDRELVRTTAVWCVLGTATMGVLVVMTILGTQPDLMAMGEVRDQTYLSNFLIGGAVGGTLTGLYAARNRRHRRELRRQANRLVLLNRLLRDKVINAATAIKGHSELLTDQHRADSAAVVSDQAQNVIDIVEDIKYISETADRSSITLGSVDVVTCLDEEIERIREEYPAAEIEWTPPTTEISVRANAQLAEVFRQLLENSVAYSDAETPRVRVSVTPSPSDVVVDISDKGPGLPAEQQALLERGEIAEFDDPTTGFGLNIVRLLTESFDGTITTAVDDGTTVSVRLPRAGENAATNSRTLTTPGVEPSRIGLTIVTALVAGVAMTVAMNAVGGSLPIIGALYGIQNPVVGMISHEFHSVVFGLVYAGILSVGSARLTSGLRNRLLIAVAFGLVLWLFAAGVVMPFWLQLVGIPASVLNLTATSLFGHVVWALTLGTLYQYGDRWLIDRELDTRDVLGYLDRL
ncbi:ATP-binding protein [Halovenus marina]|uniref:ATP-binding protein n=1 Tax=Halovenus marina TaxID=3396621 RepID=UPI003F54E36B